MNSARLGTIVKSARDIMRKDAGLNGDLDRLPLLSWLLFLRAFDAKEAEREIIEGSEFRAALSPSYQWRTWAADENLTGTALIKFVNEKLLPYLAELKSDSPGDPRNVLGQVFSGIHNRMASGYLFRDLVNQVQKIDFTSSDDIHTMAFIYESLLKEMRDAAGDGGEFYTTRPVIRFMVEQSFLELGESILDPACGTGGFLVEALDELTRGKNLGIAQERRTLAEPARYREEATAVPAVHDEPDPARRARPPDRPRERPRPHGQRDWPEHPGQRRPHQPALRRGGRGLRRRPLSEWLPGRGRPRSSSSRR